MAVVGLLLPEGDGAELVAELQGRIPGTPVTILSAREDAAQVAREVGADEAIHKEMSLWGVVSSPKRLSG